MTTKPRIEKAYLKLVKPSVGTAPAPGGGSLGTIEFPFNPKEFTLKKDAKWKSEPATGSSEAPTPEFTGTGPAQVTLQVLLDDTAGTRPLAPDVDLLLSALKPVPDTVDQNRPTPPKVLFGWGNQVILTAFAKSVSIKYALFDPEGTPLRATATITLEEVPEEPGRQNPTSGGLTARRTHRVIEGDTLASISTRVYGRPVHWRAIAEANDIDDPLALTAGRELLLPPIDEITTRTAI